LVQFVAHYKVKVWCRFETNAGKLAPSIGLSYVADTSYVFFCPAVMWCHVALKKVPEEYERIWIF